MGRQRRNRLLLAPELHSCISSSVKDAFEMFQTAHQTGRQQVCTYPGLPKIAELRACMQVNAGAAAPGKEAKVNGLLNSLNKFHKDVFGFQSLDTSGDSGSSGSVLPVTAETGTQGQTVTSAPTGEHQVRSIQGWARRC